MALAHFHRTPYYVGGERLAVGRIHYITRQAEYAPDAEARILHQGQTARGADREDLVEWNHANLPTWAQSDPVRYFSAAEVRERKGNAPCYEEWRFSLPRELTLPQQQAAAHAFLEASFGDRHPYVYAIHNPRTVDGTMEQVHCHVIFSRRMQDGIERTEAQWFRNYKSQDPTLGGAERAKRFGHLHSVKADRVLYCDTMNVFLEAAGEGARLHPDTLESRGFEREREPRAKPSDSNKAKYQGEITADWQKVMDHRAQYAADKVLEEVQAQQAWHVRTTQLGITPNMPLAQRLERVRDARDHGVRHAPQRVVASELAREAQALAHSIPRLAQYARAVQVEQRVERAYAARGQVRPRGGQQRAEQLLAHGRALGLEREAMDRLELPLIGNRTSKIYHEAGQPNYGDVVPKNQVVFWSHAEAQQAGYRRAENDHHGYGSETPMAGLATALKAMPPAQRAAALAAMSPQERAAVLRAQLQQQRQASQAASLGNRVGGAASGIAVGQARGLLHDEAGASVRPPIDRGEGW